MPSDNSLLMWSILDECNRTNSLVVSLKFEFHLMGVHTFANIHEVLALADVLGSQLGYTSSAVSTLLHRSFLLSCLWSRLGERVLRCLARVPPRISITLEDVVALTLNILVGGSPAVLGFSLFLVVNSPHLIALSLQLSEEQFMPLLGSLELFSGLAEFRVRLMLLFQYDIHGVVIRLLKVGNRGGVGFSRLREFGGIGCKQRVETLCGKRLIQGADVLFFNHLFHSYITSPPKMKPPIMTIAITAAKPTMVSTTSP